MGTRLGTMAVAALAVLGGAWPGPGWASGGIYDMNRFVREPHPFARPRAQAPAPAPATTPAPPPRAPAVQAPPAPPPPRVVPAAAPVVREPERFEPSPAFGIISEVRGGALVHDEGPFSRNEEDGFDVNLEILFVSPAFLDIIFAPRPHIGGSINTAGDTSQGYFGLTWEIGFLENFFFNISFGGSVHSGETTFDGADSKALGCRLLFRESLDLGYRFSGRHGVSVFLDHISNAKLCDKNEGLETFGLRYGYRF